jgi:hypothetical protein
MNLPDELLVYILRETCPSRPKKPHPSASHNVFIELSADGKAFVNLRLVCRTFNRIVTPILYEDLFIFISRSSRLSSIKTLFEYAADHVRALTILVYEENSHDVTEVGALIGWGIGRCIKLRKLECLGRHCTFPNRGWLSKHAPNIQPSCLTSLTFRVDDTRGGLDLSHALILFGPSLQYLEIIQWRPHHIFNSESNSPTFHLPKALPNLTHLVLQNCCPPPIYLKKLFSRIRVYQGKNSKAPSLKSELPLRILEVLYVTSAYAISAPPDIPDTLSMLSVNGIGTALEVLRIETDSIPLRSPIAAPERLALLCPNLHTFVYHFSRNPVPLLHSTLPPRLKTLELSFSIHPEDRSGEFIDAVRQFRSDARHRAPTLQSFTVLGTWPSLVFLSVLIAERDLVPLEFKTAIPYNPPKNVFRVSLLD